MGIIEFSGRRILEDQFLYGQWVKLWYFCSLDIEPCLKACALFKS